MIAHNPKQFEASAEFTQAIISNLATEKGVHAETAISAASRMAGMFLLQSCGLPLGNFTPGSPIFSDLVNEQGQDLLGAVGEALASMGVPFDAGQLDYDLPPERNPHLDLMETESLLEPSFRAILRKYSLTEEEGAYAAAISTAILIQKCAGFLNPHVSYVIAAYGMVEASKTVPFDAGQSLETVGA